MGIDDGYLRAVRASKTMLTYPPGWSEENHTGSWRNTRPAFNLENCRKCDMCWLHCPDSAISRTMEITINYTYCKGCGICAVECQFNAITMRPEEEET